MPTVTVDPVVSKSPQPASQRLYFSTDGLAQGSTTTNARAGCVTRTVVLMSHDAIMIEKLRGAAEMEKCAIEWVGETFGLYKMLQAARPDAVLLDLDMHTGAAWEAADRLLLEPNCPPLILLSARVEHPEFSLAAHTHSVIDKFTAPSRMMQIVGQAIEAAPSARDEQIAVQRIIVLRLNPFHPAQYRDFGIND